MQLRIGSILCTLDKTSNIVLCGLPNTIGSLQAAVFIAFTNVPVPGKTTLLLLLN